MFSGIVNTDSLTQLFRAISQRRRHGFLRLESKTTSMEVYFISGKIVEVRENGWSACPAIYERLRSCKKLNKELKGTSALAEMEASEVYDLLVGQGYVSHEYFMMARAALALDMLHGINAMEGAYFQFTQKLVEFDDRISLKFSPGQILLDFVEFDSNIQRFQEIFGPYAGYRIKIYVREEPSTLSGVEVELWKAIVEGVELETIINTVLLSENDLRSALVSLHDRGLIQVEQGEKLLEGEDDVLSVVAEEDAQETASQAEPEVSSKSTVKADPHEMEAVLKAAEEYAGGEVAIPSHLPLSQRLNLWLLNDRGSRVSTGVVAVGFLFFVGLMLPEMVKELIKVISRSMSFVN